MTTDRIVAWRVAARGFPGAGIYAAVTPAMAKFLASDAIQNVGYMVAWEDLTAERAPEFDSWVAMRATGLGWDEEYARRCLAENAQEGPWRPPGRVSEG